MATCGEDKGPVPVVLRVKRKRTEDPAEALGSRATCMLSHPS